MDNILKIIKLPLLLLLVLSCGRSNAPQERVSSEELLQQLHNKAELYQSKLPSDFILTDKCDSLLFSGLYSAALPGLIDIRQAQNSEDNSWHRRPSKDCGPEFGNSRSTISRDMILGLYWHIWKHQDLDLAIELMQDLKSNLYHLKGEGTPGELFMTPAMMNTLAEMIKVMGGPEYTVELLFPFTYSEDSGYISHLVTWHILLRGEILGKVSASELNYLEVNKDRNPLNPLFQAAYHKYTDGNQDIAISLLLDTTEWPSDRLPSTEEHCDDWPIQRDYEEKDWGRCEPYKEHTGAALLAVYHLVIK